MVHEVDEFEVEEEVASISGSQEQTPVKKRPASVMEVEVEEQAWLKR